MRYLDANIFVRYLTQDEPAMSAAALMLFQRVRDGAEEVRVLEATIAEVVYVLSSPHLYDLSRADIVDRLAPVLTLNGVLVQNRSQCLDALSLYASNRAVNFADCLIASAVLEETPHEIYSYDRGFDRVEGIVRLEP